MDPEQHRRNLPGPRTCRRLFSNRGWKSVGTEALLRAAVCSLGICGFRGPMGGEPGGVLAPLHSETEGQLGLGGIKITSRCQAACVRSVPLAPRPPAGLWQGSWVGARDTKPPPFSSVAAGT